MISLLLDSSNTYLNVALGINNKIVSKISYECFQRQSEMMIPEIHNILKENNINSKDINEVLVTFGPGSYTGLRIALTIAKIYAYSLNIPCYTFSSLEVLQKENTPSICLMNARSKRSYFGVYLNNEVLVKDQVLTNLEVLNYINEHNDYALCGGINYLNLTSNGNDIFLNMIRLKDEKHLVKDILSLKAIYLKD